MASPNDKYNRGFYWTLFGVFVAGLFVGQLPDLMDRPVYAQIPDSGAQRHKMVSELREIRNEITKMRQWLRTQTFKVRISGVDESVLSDQSAPDKNRSSMRVQDPDTQESGPGDAIKKDDH
jgi:hypothetical protein